ncbi:RNA-guided endonuclease IscB [Streptomyces spinosisporus]|uniref:RNA-guided endonuclease IscB n=1 Tax=Streptomyces spinosisporus TaxID=2927582 RepID=UPI003556DC88
MSTCTRAVPVTIRLKDRALADSEVDGVQLRIDPGSKGTGLHLTDEKEEINERGATGTVRRGLVSVELQHRGDQIRGCMQQRAGYRRRRRSANCRYRAPRSDNRTRRESWLPPSLRHRVDTVFSQAARLCRYAPVAEIHVESGGFDTHSTSTGTGTGMQGTLAGTDARAYLHARWNSACSYCGVTGVRLNIEHLRPRSRGGSSRISNLVLACVPCNRRKGTLPVEVFLAASPDRLARILQQGETPLHDAAAMNATRWPVAHPRRAVRRTPGPRARGRNRSFPFPGSRRQGNRTRLLRPHDSRPIRVSAASARPYQAALRIRHRRPRTGHRAHGQVDGHMDRPRLRTSQRAAQPQHAQRPHQRLPPESAATAEGRRLRLQHPPGTPPSISRKTG